MKISITLSIYFFFNRLESGIYCRIDGEDIESYAKEIHKMDSSRRGLYKEYPTLSQSIFEYRKSSPWLISDKMLMGIRIPLFYRKSTGQHVISFEIVAHLLRIIEKNGLDAWENWKVEDLLPKRWKKQAKDFEKSQICFSSDFLKATHFFPTLMTRKVGKNLHEFIGNRKNQNIFELESQKAEDIAYPESNETKKDEEITGKESIYPGDLLVEGYNCAEEGYAADEAVLEAVLKGVPGFMSMKNHALIVDENGTMISRSSQKGNAIP